MGFIVYIDFFWFVNWGMDLLLLYILKKITCKNGSFIRLATAAAFGALGAVLAILVPNMNLVLKFLLLYVLVSAGMILIAFSYQGLRNLLFQIVELYFLSFFVGGFLHFLWENININTLFKLLTDKERNGQIGIGFMGKALLIVGLCIPILMRIGSKIKDNYKTLYPVCIRFGENCVEGIGLLDTGNRLREGISKKPVMIGEYAWLKSVFSENQKSYIEHYMETDNDSFLKQEEIPILLTPIPFHSLGNEQGILAAVKVNEVIIGKGKKRKQSKNVYVALYKGNLSEERDFQIILHRELT